MPAQARDKINFDTTFVWASTTNGGLDTAGVQYTDASSDTILPVCAFYNIEDPSIYGPSFLYFSSAASEVYEYHDGHGDPGAFCFYWAELENRLNEVTLQGIGNTVGVSYCHDWIMLGSPEAWKNVHPTGGTSTRYDPGVQNNNTISQQRTNTVCDSYKSGDDLFYKTVKGECKGEDNGIPLSSQTCIEYPTACLEIQDTTDSGYDLLKKINERDVQAGGGGGVCEWMPDPDKDRYRCWPWVIFDDAYPVGRFRANGFASTILSSFTPNIGISSSFGLTEFVNEVLEQRVIAPGTLNQFYDWQTAAYQFHYEYPKHFSTHAAIQSISADKLHQYMYTDDTKPAYQAVFDSGNPVKSYELYNGPSDAPVSTHHRIFFANQRNVSEPYDQRCFGPPHNNMACTATWTTSDLKQRGCAGYGRCPYTWNAATKTATYCSGRGRCSMTGVCACDFPYTGVMCEIDIKTTAFQNLYLTLMENLPVGVGEHEDVLKQLLAANVCSGHGTLRFRTLSDQYGDFYCDCFPGWGGTTKHFKWKATQTDVFGGMTFALEWMPSDLLLYAAAVLATPTSSMFANTPEWSGTKWLPSAQLRTQQCAIWIPRMLAQEPEFTNLYYRFQYNYVSYDAATSFTVNILASEIQNSMKNEFVYAGNQPTFMGIQEYAELMPALSKAESSTGADAVLPAVLLAPYKTSWSPDYDVLVTDPTRWGNRTGTCIYGWTGLACDIKCPACNATHSRCAAKNDTIQLVSNGTYWDGERTQGYAVCECDYNWGGVSCDTQICPQASGQDQVCGGSTRGICVDKSPSDTSITTIRKCECFDGYHGYACELASPCPYNSKFGGICSNPQPAVHENKTSAHGQCNNRTGKCECFPTQLHQFKVGYTGTQCEVRSCPFHSGQECSGAKDADNPPNDICINRDDTSSMPKCDCVRTLPSGMRTSTATWGKNAGPDQRWGMACEFTYKEACWALNGNGLFCSGYGYACVPDNITDPYSKPKCKCDPLHSGEFCEISSCPGGQGCVAAVFNSTTSTCSANNICGNGLCYSAPIPGNTATVPKCKCYGYQGRFFAGEACNDEAPECFAGNGKEGCNGPDHGLCVRQDDGRYGCKCKPWYNSPQCATQTDCMACNQTGQVCQEFHNTTFTCGCDPRYYKTVLGGSSPVCLEVCNSTGGVPDAVTNQCKCPSGSVWLDQCGDLPAGVACHGSKFKGCRKLCPLYANKYECGLSDHAAAFDKCYGVGGTPINASSSTPTPNCTCQFAANDPSRPHDSATQWFVQSLNGSCEPWCINGSPLPASNNCNCSNTRFTGQRCNQPACNGHGHITGDGSTCVCDSPWAYSPSDDCATDACAASGGYYPGSANYKVDHCACHLGSSGEHYRNASDPSRHMHECVSLCENGGIPDPVTNSSTCTNCTGVWGGVFCDVPLCTHGSTPSSDGLSCVCDRNTWPQFGGTYCNASLCSNNAPAYTTGRGCNCTAVSRHLTGTLCDIDRCAQAPSHGYLNLSVSSTQCQCDIGYQLDASDAYRCSRDACNPGVAQACSGGACLHPTTMPGYNCNCGLHATRDENGTCYKPQNATAAGTVPCVNGVVLRNHSQQTTSCECYEGWAGLACNITACVLENQVYDPVADACKCIFPFTGALCDQHTCGPHAGGAPICNQTIANSTVVADRHCWCNCSLGFRPRYYPFPDNNTRPCVLDCHRPFSLLPLLPNTTEAPTNFDAVGLKANNWLTDANISTSQCPCAGNFTGALCTGNPKYPERDQNTTKWINDLLEAHKEKWPVWKYVVVSMITALGLAAIAFSIYKCVEDRRMSKGYSKVSTRDHSSALPGSSRFDNFARSKRPI